MMLFAEIDWPVAKDIILGLVAGVVTLGVPFFSYLSIRAKLSESNHDGRIKILEAHVKDCVEVMDTAWPSDDFKGKPFAQRVSEARQFAIANGLPWTFKDVSLLARKYVREKVDLAKRQTPSPPETNQGGLYS